MSLWSQIKQRRITQVVFAYLAGGWMVLVVIDQVVDREVLPSVVYRSALTIYLVGILAALVIGWYHGELGEQRAPAREIALLSLIGVLGIALTGWVIRGEMQQATLRDALVDSGVDLRRIAVLYFDDLSADGSAGAIAEGITEGLIGTLSEVADLDVTSRNGSREVQTLGLAADSAARLLDVGTLVDGTVDQQGDEIRVSVRVLEGQSGVPLFRDSYTWPAAEVGTVGNELAREVGNALREQLGVEVRLRESQASAPNSAAWLQVARAEQLSRQAEVALQAGDAEAAYDAFEAADAALVQAQDAAPQWVEPPVLRGWIAYEQYVFAEDVDELIGMMGQAVDFADRALELEPDSPGALELRGTALYRRWLYQAEDEATLDQVFARARADLERARDLDRDRASVNSTLSHLYYQVEDWSQAVLAARAAYQEDAFLASIDGVIQRLFHASYDLGNHRDAENWCREGFRRFPEEYPFTQCQIYLMTMDGGEPDVAEAWSLYGRMVSLMPETPLSTLIQGITRTFIGGVVGRAGLADSANAVLEAARMPESLDPVGEQMSMEAAMRSVAGDTDGSVQVLGRFMAAHPGHFPGEHWWWRNVQADPRFQALRDTR